MIAYGIYIQKGTYCNFGIRWLVTQGGELRGYCSVPYRAYLPCQRALTEYVSAVSA